MTLRWWHAWTAGLLFVGTAAAAPWFARELAYAWEPASGPVVSYECEDSLGRTVATLGDEPRVSIEPGVAPDYRVRCRALDPAGLAGPWSEWSDPLAVRRPEADLDGSGQVGATDFIRLSKQFGAWWEVGP